MQPKAQHSPFPSPGFRNHDSGPALPNTISDRLGERFDVRSNLALDDRVAGVDNLDWVFHRGNLCRARIKLSDGCSHCGGLARTHSASKERQAGTLGKRPDQVLVQTKVVAQSWNLQGQVAHRYAPSFLRVRKAAAVAVAHELRCVVRTPRVVALRFLSVGLVKEITPDSRCSAKGRDSVEISSFHKVLGQQDVPAFL